MRQALIGIALAILVAGCGTSVVPPQETTTPTAQPEAIGPTRICNNWVQDVPPPVTCTEAIGRVLLALGADAPFVEAASFQLGVPCPPNARCLAPPPGVGFVVVRIEGGRTGLVRVAFADGDVTVSPPEDPVFDLWPSSGEAVPPVARPDVGAAAPVEIAARDPFPLCGDLRDGVDDQRIGRRCFFGAVLDGRPAELVIRSVDAAGNPVAQIYRFTGRGPVLVHRSPRGGPAGPRWLRDDCAIGSAFDDEMIFVVDECL